MFIFALIKATHFVCDDSIQQKRRMLWGFPNNTRLMLFAILQKYDFSSKSQQKLNSIFHRRGCLRYCKSTIFQANHNKDCRRYFVSVVVCDTAKVRFFKQITTLVLVAAHFRCCLRYCKSTIFQANHNKICIPLQPFFVVCDTAKVRFFKQITTNALYLLCRLCCLRYCKSTIFQANHNQIPLCSTIRVVVCDTAKVRFFKQITTVELKLY